MKKRFNLTWRIVTTMLLLLALMPALVGGVAVAATYGDTTKPHLLSISWADADVNGRINAGDNLIFYFDESMDVSSLNEVSVINARLDSTADSPLGNDYGSTGVVFAWGLSDTRLTITLGADCRDTLAGKTVNPSDAVKDKQGNIDDTTAPGPKIPIAPDSTDNYAPRLLSVTWMDHNLVGADPHNLNGIIDSGDWLVFLFSESVSSTLPTAANIDTYLGMGTHIVGTAGANAITWWAGNTRLMVQLATGEQIVGGETVTPAFVDWHGNTCNTSSTVTIPLPPNPNPPALVDVLWYDQGGTGSVDLNDWLILRFSESVDSTGVNSGNVANYFTMPATFWGATGPADFGTDTAGTMWKIKFSATPGATIGSTINLNPAFPIVDRGDDRQCSVSATAVIGTKTTDNAPASADIYAPILRSICWWDMNNDGIHNPADLLLFY